MSHKSLLLTGGSGFIGHHLIPLLLEKGYNITATTRDKKNFNKYSWSSDISIIETDLLDLHKTTKKNQFEGIIHLAWGNIQNVNCLSHFEQSLYQSYFFLKHMALSGTPKMFVTGTCLEYGKQNGALSTTTDCKPTTAYGFAKHVLHQKLRHLQSNLNFQLNWGRVFYIYGEGQSGYSIIPQLDKAIDENLRYFNMSYGDQLRDYLCVSEVARQIVNNYESDSNSLTNICSGKPISIKTLVERHISKRGSNIKLNLGYYDYNQYEPMAFWGSI